MPLNPLAIGHDLTSTRHHFYTETATEIIYRKVIRPGDTVLDVGANRAYHTIRLLDAVGDTGRVHAFEPNPDLFAGLANLGPRLRLWPFAVGDNPGLANLYVPHGLDGWSSLQDIRAELPNHAFQLRTTVQVAIDKLDELHDVSATFVKIDVERWEKEAIAGMSHFLQRCFPVVICEGNLDENFAALEALGYACFDFFGQPATTGNLLANFVACPPAWRDRLGAILPTPAEWERAGVTAATL